ncbi:unnamed protein product, partial [Staurois parvus]
HLARQRALGHQASGIGSSGSTVGTASSGIIGPSGWVDTSSWVGYTGSSGIRLNHGRRVLRRQADRFGYWQDGIGWKEFSLFSGFSYWSAGSKRRFVSG